MRDEDAYGRVSHPERYRVLHEAASRLLERLAADYLAAELKRIGARPLPGLGDFFHEFLYTKSDEEADCVRVAGQLLDKALYSMLAAMRPGVKEYELAAAAAQPILEGGGRINFTIVGSTPMDDPALAFGNPWPSARPIHEGDIILNELACGYRGFTVQLGSPICVGSPPDWIHDFFYDVVRPGFDAMAAQLLPGNTWEQVRLAGRSFGEAGYDGRPLRIFSAGKAYRLCQLDAMHLEAFHQAEVLCVDESSRLDPWRVTGQVLQSIDVTLGTRPVKVIPTEYPMCKQAWELAVEHHGQWYEALAWGVFTDRIVAHLGADPARHIAVGVGYGLERLAMLRFGIDDIRKIEAAQVT